MFRKRWVPFFLAIGLGSLFWLVDTLLDFYVYYPGTFLDLLILDPPRHELYVRAVVLAIFAIFGYLITTGFQFLRRSEERYRSIVDSREIYICRFTPDTKITFANEAYCERRGVTQEEIIGQSFMTWVPEEDQAFIKRQYQSLTPQDPLTTYEHRVITQGGKVTWQRWTDEALFNQQGEPVEYQSIGYDITERVFTQETYQTLVEHSLQGLEIIQEDGIVFANPAMADLSGYSVQELLDFTFEDVAAIVHPEDREDVIRNLSRRIAGEDAPQRQEFRFLRKDGEVRWVETLSTRIPYHGEPANQVAVIDITERVRAEQNLREEKDRAQKFLDVAGTIMVALNAQGEVTLINQHGADILGYSKEEIMGENWFDEFLPQHVREETKEYFGRMMKGKMESVASYENPILTKGGEERVVAWHNVILKDNGQITGSLSSGLDITERIQAEEELKSSEKRYRTLFETMSQGVVYQNAEGEIISANPAAEEILGLTLDQMQGRTSLHPEWRVITMEGAPLPGEKHPSMVALRTGEKVENFVMGVYHPRKDEHVWISVSAVPQYREGRDQPYQVFTTFLDITERVEAERALREREALLLETGRMARVGGWEIDVETDAVWWSRVTREIHEVPPDYEPTLEEAVDFFPPEVHPKLESAIREAREEGIPYDLELPFITATGTRLWIHTMGQSEFENGKCVRVHGTFQDITERVEAKRALRDSEKRFRSIFESAPFGMNIVDRDNQSIEVNRALQEMLGYSEDEFLRMTFVDFTHPDDIEDSLKLADAILSGESNYLQMKKRYLCKDGQVIWGKTAVTAVRNQEGGFQYFVAMVEEITEQVRAERELRRSEEKYHTLFDSATDALFVVDEDSLEILDANQTAQEMYGYTREELLTLRAPDLSAEPEKTKDVIHQFQEDDNNNGRSETSVPVRYHKKKDGAVMVVEIRMKHITLHGRRVNLSLIRDITQRTMMERELQQRKYELESLTARLVEADEIRRRKFARNLHDQVGQTLSLLRFNLDRLKRMVGGDGHSVESVEEKIENAVFLVDDTSQKIREVINDLRPPVLDDYGIFAALHWYADQLQDQVSFRLEVRGEEFRPRLPSRVENMLFRITQEALANVVSHARASDVLITLREENGQVTLEIADDGRGFGPSNVDSGEDDQGWGLTFMRERVEVIGGTFRIESGVEKGTLVRVQVPRSMR